MDTLHNSVLARRKKLGLSQAALAERVGISRQALSAIENGQTAPSGQVLLAVARALGAPVEALFWLGDTGGAQIDARWAATAPPRVGARVTLAWIRGAWAAHPLTDPRTPGAGVVAALDGDTVRVALFDGDLARWRDGHLLALGCDPAIALLAAHVARRTPGLRITWLDAPSGAALDAVADGLAHVAGIHLHDRETDAFNVPFVERRIGAALVVNLARWEQGLVVATANPHAIEGPEDLGRSGLRVLQRPTSAGAQQLLERALADAGAALDPAVAPVVAASHETVAQAVAMGAADVGIATRGAALAHGLHFIPLASERFDLVLPAETVPMAAAQQLLETAASTSFRRELEALGGYETSDTGRVIADLRAPA